MLRDVQGDHARIEDNLLNIQQQGAPNYFGPQRFGHDGANVEQGHLMLTREIRVRQQKNKSIYLSAVRSFIFNEILADRINKGLWNQSLEGDVLDEHGTPTGALWGRGRISTTLAAAELENAIAEQHLTLCEGMEHAGLKQERRPLAAIPQNMTWQWLDDSQLHISFTLAPGYYATSVLREILDTQEPDRFNTG